MSPSEVAASPSWQGPVLVTGAGGFVGGHVARALAAAGYPVRGLSRRPPSIEQGDPPIDWVIGDLRRAPDRMRAIEGMKGVIHTAGWVSLGFDRRGESRAINVEATRALLDEAEGVGVERFVYTSTLWTVAAGTSDYPADEDSAWNLDTIRSPYSESKSEAERLVLQRDGARLGTTVLCPGLVIGPRDLRPTSTRLLLMMARAPLIVLPRGGIPVVDARVLALAHVRALERAERRRRYVVAGPYLSYQVMAQLVGRVIGRPPAIVTVPDAMEGPLTWIGWVLNRLAPGRGADFSPAAIAGGFLRLHVSGARADTAFGLRHPPPLVSIFDALDDHRRSGRAPWLRSLVPAVATEPDGALAASLREE
jgi:dihydroflavonol-4-reductase